MSLLVRSSLRYLFRRPWQFGLAVVGVALGVAVVVSIGLANASASRAFTFSTEAITGRATHQVVGGPRGLPDDAFRRLTLAAGLERAAPVVEDWVVVPLKLPGGPSESDDRRRRPSRAFHLLGVDPFSEGPFRSYLGPAGGAPRDGSSAVEGGLGALLTRPGTVVMAAETAAELGLRPGDAFTVRAAGVPRRLELAGTLAPKDADARRAISDLLLTDIASAQETLGRIGRLDRIDLLLSPGEAGKRELARAAAVLAAGAPGAQILPAAGRTRSTEEMTRSFRLNLTALSLLALVCGVFLIYNTMTFSVVQRRTWIGTLRALGVSRREIFALVLGEAAVVAVLGTALGLGAGVLLGRGLVRLVTQTINDLYFVVSVRELAVSPAILLLGALLGIGATLLAALVPALEATQAPPRAALLRSTLEGRLRRSLPRATALGFALLALGGLLLALPGGLPLSFAGLFAVILGFALLAPVATVLLMGLLRRPLGAMLGVLGRMAAGGVVASLSRTAVAIAALVIAVSVTVGIGVMIDSFRQTVVRWLAMTLQSDVFVAVPSRAGGFAGVDLDPEVARQAMALPGVAGGHTIRRVELPSPKGPVRLVVMGATAATLATTFELKEGSRATAWPAFQTGDAVLVSEPYASRTGIGTGATVRLPTEQGERAFRVMGVYYDYASDQGVLLMSRATYLRHWSDRALSGFALDLAPGADPDRVAAQLRATLGGERGLSVQSNRALKKISLEIFDRTFLITSVLRLLAALVAFIGVLASLMALQLERGRELGVLRANGMTPGQVWQLVTAQTGLMGLAAGLLSLPVGLSLAAVMIYVVNRRSFGWTIRMELAPQVLLQAFLLALAAALLAGLYPAYKMARTSPALALREE